MQSIENLVALLKKYEQNKSIIDNDLKTKIINSANELLIYDSGKPNNANIECLIRAGFRVWIDITNKIILGNGVIYYG